MENFTEENLRPWISTTTRVYNNVTIFPQYDDELGKFEIMVLCILCFMALFGNAVVLIVLRIKKTTLTRMQLLIVYLSVTDISVALFHILPTIILKINVYFLGDISACRVYQFITVAELYASSFVLIVTALDRYISICHPLAAHMWTNRRVHMTTALALFLALMCSLPQLDAVLVDFHGGKLCRPNLTTELANIAYSWWAFCSVFFVPLLLLIFFYGRICFVVWQSMRGRECTQSVGSSASRYVRKPIKCRISSQTSSENRVKNYSDAREKDSSRNPRAICRGVSKSKIKTIKLTFSVVACFIICYTPFFTVLMARTYDVELSSAQTPALVILSLLPSLNSCTNPWIYLAFSGKDFRFPMDTPLR
ncbi:octopressin receptor isoform X2 [Octopus bimaculoides]|uniref:octopressin receptor isoform X2 n=1 Tax=Octopus bimaculoides TaxID=37653 RepID=UPI0022E01845|nr:octopressin receptor isoform X2 [Octopus bimaculoides]